MLTTSRPPSLRLPVPLVAVAGIAASVVMAASQVLGADPAAAPPVVRRPLAAEFELQVDHEPAVRGLLTFDVQGQTCVEIATPRPQRIWMGRGAMVIYNVAEQKLFRQSFAETSLPPFLDAVVVSLRPGAESLPNGAVLASRRMLPEGIEETWRVDQGPASARLAVRTLEGPAGALRTDVLDGDGALLRRYRFGDRRPERGLSLAGRIEADYHAKGKLRRTERWSLQWRRKSGDARAATAPSSEGPCLRVTGQPQETRM